jgi:type IX secretion system PorP/SprF family membrane protein
MMKKLRLTLFIFLLLAGQSAIGQQFPISSHYLVNPNSLNPAFAGAFNRSELFMNFRRDWSAIEGSPQTARINGNFRVHNNMFLGADIYTDFADIFYRLRAGLNYTYRLEIGNEQHLSFGLSGHFYQSVIRLDQANVDMDDPVLRNLDRLFSSNYNAAFGLVYSNRDFYLAFGMPVMFRTKNAYENIGSGNFAFERAYDVYATNSFSIHHSWQFQPGLLIRKTVNQPIIFDVSTLFVYNKQLWLGALYRNTSLFGFTAGGRLLDGIVINYTYEVGVGGIHRYAGNSHEITLGFSRKQDNTTTRRLKADDKKRVDIREKPEKEKVEKIKHKDKQSKIKKKPVKKTAPKRSLKYAPYEKF